MSGSVRDRNPADGTMCCCVGIYMPMSFARGQRKHLRSTRLTRGHHRHHNFRALHGRISASIKANILMPSLKSRCLGQDCLQSCLVHQTATRELYKMPCSHPEKAGSTSRLPGVSDSCDRKEAVPSPDTLLPRQEASTSSSDENAGTADNSSASATSEGGAKPTVINAPAQIGLIMPNPGSNIYTGKQCHFRGPSRS